MKVVLRAHSRRVKKKLESDLYWYDSSSGKMHKFRGSRLVFDYDRSSGQSVPRAIVEDTIVYENSWSDIDSLIKKHKNHIEIDEIRPRYSATFDVDMDYFYYEMDKDLKSMSVMFEIESDGKPKSSINHDPNKVEHVKNRIEQPKNKIAGLKQKMERYK